MYNRDPYTILFAFKFYYNCILYLDVDKSCSKAISLVKARFLESPRQPKFFFGYLVWGFVHQNFCCEQINDVNPVVIRKLLLVIRTNLLAIKDSFAGAG